MTKNTKFEVDEDWYRWPILDTALALHTSYTGASDPLSDLDLVARYKWMERRIAGWRPSQGSEIFDSAVLFVCREALNDAKQDIDGRILYSTRQRRELLKTLVP